MAVNEPPIDGTGSMSGGGGFRIGGIRQAVAGRIAAKITADGVRKLTSDFGGLLKVLKDVRAELVAINKVSSGGGTGGIGQGTPTGAAGTGSASSSSAGLIGNITQALPGGGGGGPSLPTAAVRGAGGFNYGRAGMALAVGANIAQTGFDVINDRFARNVAQSTPISSMDVRTASMYGPQMYKEMERNRYNAGQGTFQFLGSRENAQAAQAIGLGFGGTMASSQQFLGQVAGMVQASGGSINATQAAAQVGNFASPMVSNRARAMGIMAYKDNGVLNDPLKVGLDYIKDYEKRNGVTLNAIDYSNLQAPGSPHRARMKQLYGLSDEAIDMAIQAGMQNMQFRGIKGGGGRDINFASTEDLSKIGLNARNSLGLAATRLNTTGERREARFFGNNESDMTQRLASENAIQEALSDTEQAFGDLLGPMHEFERVLKVVTSGLGLLGGAMMVGNMFGGGGGGGGGGGLIGALKGLVGKGGGPGGVPGMPGGGGGISGMTALKGAGVAGGAALALGGLQMATSARTGAGVLGGVGMTTAGGAMIGLSVGGPVGAAIGAGVGLAVGGTLGAIHYFRGVDKKNVHQGFEAGMGMTEKDLVANLGDYVRNSRTGRKGEGAGAKQRGRFDAFARRRGALLAAALDEGLEAGLFKDLSTTQGADLAELVQFFGSDGVFNDGKLWDNKAKAQPFISKLQGTPTWKKYFSISDPFAYVPNNTPQAESLVMSGEQAYQAAMSGEKSGDAMFAAAGDPWRTGDAIDDRATAKGETWNKLDSRMKERLLKMFRASGGRVWLGGGWRSSAQQEAMFRDRYRVDPNGSIEWQGQKWRHVKGAAAAPPGRSMHEIGLAADLEGDLAWMNAHAAEFGLKDAHDINNEPWHVQPSELPYGRREFEAGGGTSDSGGASGSTGATVPTAAAAPQAFSGGGGTAFSGLGYSIMAAAAGTSAGGGLLSSPSDAGAALGGAAAGVGTIVGAGAGGSLQSFFSEVLTAIGAPVTQNNLDKLAAVAKQEGNGVDHFNPFNTNTRAPGSVSFNSAGVQKYPDWATGVGVTARLLNKRPTMGSNLLADAPFADWINAVNNFYASWGGGRNTISQESARAFLSHPVTGPGDAAFDPGITMAPSAGAANVTINVQITSTGNARYDAQALGDAVRPVLTNVMAEISTKRGS